MGENWFRRRFTAVSLLTACFLAVVPVGCSKNGSNALESSLDHSVIPARTSLSFYMIDALQTRNGLLSGAAFSARDRIYLFKDLGEDYCDRPIANSWPAILAAIISDTEASQKKSQPALKSLSKNSKALVELTQESVNLICPAKGFPVQLRTVDLSDEVTSALVEQSGFTKMDLRTNDLAIIKKEGRELCGLNKSRDHLGPTIDQRLKDRRGDLDKRLRDANLLILTNYMSVACPRIGDAKLNDGVFDTLVPIPPLLTRQIQPGTVKVGKDVKPGTYQTETPDCYWERLSGFSGETKDVLANGFTGANGGFVAIESSDLAFTSKCVWVRDPSET
jgi:hypothetical protein